MSFSSEEIAKIHVVINSGDIPDFSEKMRDAAKSVSQLQEEIQQTQKDLGILAARGDQNSENFKIMQKHLSTLQTRLKNTNKEMKYYTESIDINLMSSNQLNARSKVLTNTLNALSKEAEPDRWNELNNELIKVVAGWMRCAWELWVFRIPWTSPACPCSNWMFTAANLRRVWLLFLAMPPIRQNGKSWNPDYVT